LADVQNNPGVGGRDALRSFQLLKDVKAKSDPDWGKSIASYICSTVFSGIGNGYFWIRNSRFRINRDLASGKDDPMKFQDRLEMNGKTNYVNLNWQSTQIINTIISKMVGRWMNRNEKIVVTATDSNSVQQKTEGYKQAEFYMMHGQMIQQLEQASGTQIIPKGQFIPEDQEGLDLWAAQYQRLPEEILSEEGTNQVFDSNGFTDQNKEKLLHDTAETGLLVTRVWMDSDGVIHIDWIKPENFFYSFSEYNDLHDCSWQGDETGMKITEIRGRFGQEFGGHLTEEQLWEIAQTAQEYQLYDKLRWLVEWNVSVLRPYDEWNVPVTRFYIKTLDKDPYTLVTTKKNKSTIIKKGAVGKPADNEEFVEEKYIKIYEGLYIRRTETLLSWGLWENMIRPQDPKEYGQCLFPYAPYMYQNQDMKNVAVPEKIQRPVEQMVLILYKMEQIVMGLIPPGAAINTDALQEVDFGLGEKNKIVDPVKFYQQKGLIYYRGRDAEGNPNPVPITELQNSGFLPQMDGLIKMYEFQYKVLSDELGMDPSIVLNASKPRVTTDNVQTSVQAGDEATDYMYRVFLYCMEGTAKRVSCLLRDSVIYGSLAYRHIMQEQDIKGRAFATKAKMLPQDQEMAVLENFMAQALQATPELIQFVDPFKLRRIAQDDVKLAEIYLRQCQKKMLQFQQQQAQQNAQQNAQAQQDSLKMKGQIDMEHEQMKAKFEQQKTADLSRADKEKILLTGFTQMWAAGMQVPAELKQLEQEIITNVALPLFAENTKNGIALQQGMKQMQQSQQQQPADSGEAREQDQQDQEPPDQSQQNQPQ
jgi:hypothetical protein